MAMRTQSLLNLNLPPLFWKMLIGQVRSLLGFSLTSGSDLHSTGVFVVGSDGCGQHGRTGASSIVLVRVVAHC
jgi:hypothetical protein